MWQRVVLIAPAVVLALLAAGCQEGPDRALAEDALRGAMETGTGSAVRQLTLEKKGKSLVGEAVMANGYRYDVSATADDPSSTIVSRWVAGQELAEKIVREGLEKKHGSAVRSLTLTKLGVGLYEGTAVLESGARLDIRTGQGTDRLVWQDEPAR
jgi:hypothetical protein